MDPQSPRASSVKVAKTGVWIHKSPIIIEHNLKKADVIKIKMSLKIKILIENPQKITAQIFLPRELQIITAGQMSEGAEGGAWGEGEGGQEAWGLGGRTGLWEEKGSELLNAL